MRRALIVALALCVPIVMPAGAPAHPTGSTGAFGTGENWLIPTVGSKEAGLATAEAAAATTAGDPAVYQNLRPLAHLPKGELTNVNSDLAFWGRYAIVGNYDGFQVLDVSRPDAPRYVSQTRCPGSQNDVSVFKNLIVTSTDSTRNDDSCTSRAKATTDVEYWEGLRIWDWSNPKKPVYVKSVETDCGSHTHTTIPDLARNRLIVYVSSYSPGALADCLPPHDKISIVEIPLSNPSGARVLSEPVLFPSGGQPSTSGCHDITAYPAYRLAAGACMGEGIIMDISDLEEPQVISTITDPNFSFWHSATFSNDADTVVFTDELGGGTAARCRATDAGNRGANGYYDIGDPARPVFKGYFKIQDFTAGRVQSDAENCVSHNGSLIPTRPGKDLMVQAWYQGGTSVIDFTDPSKPVEVAYFDRGPVAGTGGHWSSYWYNGRIYGSEIARGFDVLSLASGFGQGSVKQPYLNAQTQQPLTR